MAKIVFLLSVNLLMVYNAIATSFDSNSYHNPPRSSSDKGYRHYPQSDRYHFHPTPSTTPIPICEPREPVVVDCTDNPLDSSCQIIATNENGTCVRETDCITSDRILNYLTPPFCGYHGETKLVCCPPPEDENRASGRSRPTNEREIVRNMPVPQGGGPISEEMCRSFYEGANGRPRRNAPNSSAKRLKRNLNPPQKRRTCTRTTTTTPAPITTTSPPRFAVSPAFGTRTRVGDYPYMAAIGFPNGPGVLNFPCGGFLVDRCYVITSAHCLVGGTPTHVRVGGVSLRDKSIQNTDLPIDPNGITPHPNYDPLQQYNDIAVLRLGTCAPTSIRPACLWTERFVGYENLTALGYGLTEGGGTSDDLLQVDLTLYGNDFCQNVFGSRSNRRRRGITDEHLCAGRPLGDDAAYYDTCEGDSGGPIGATRERLFSGIPIPYVMGVTQFGRGCGITPAAIYARVSAHIGWLESVIWLSQTTS